MYTLSSIPIHPGCVARRKTSSHDHLADDFYHRSSTSNKDTLTIQNQLTADPVSYVHWYDSIATSLPLTNFASFLVCDLVPLDDADVDKYQQKLAVAHQQCLDNQLANQYLNETLYRSLAPELHVLMQPECLASENFEGLKSSFHHRLNAFLLLDLESKFDFDPSDIMQFLHNLTSLSKIYYHVFREPASADLKVHWIMDALNKNYLLNKPVIDQIQVDWSKITRDPYYIRSILTKFAYIYKHQKSAYTSPL